ASSFAEDNTARVSKRPTYQTAACLRARYCIGRRSIHLTVLFNDSTDPESSGRRRTGISIVRGSVKRRVSAPRIQLLDGTRHLQAVFPTLSRNTQGEGRKIDGTDSKAFPNQFSR